MNTAHRTFWLYWLPVLALCAAIFVQSAFPSPDLGLSFPHKDKVLHMAAYGLLAALFYRACRLTWPGRLSPMLLLVSSVLFSTCYGLSDEFHQAFVAARQADVLDAIADCAGAILGARGYMTVTGQGRPIWFSKPDRRLR
jgi:VanZ family protein